MAVVIIIKLTHIWPLRAAVTCIRFSELLGFRCDVLLHVDLRMLLFYAREELLSMAADLGPGPCPNKGLDLFPVSVEEEHGYIKFIRFGITFDEFFMFLT